MRLPPSLPSLASACCSLCASLAACTALEEGVVGICGAGAVQGQRRAHGRAGIRQSRHLAKHGRRERPRQQNGRPISPRSPAKPLPSPRPTTARPAPHHTPTSAGLWALRASSMAPGSRKMAISSTALLAAPRSGSSRRCSSSMPLSKFSLKVGARARRRAEGAACGPAGGGVACGQVGSGGGLSWQRSRWVGREGCGAGGQAAPTVAGEDKRRRERGSEGGPGWHAGRHRHTNEQQGAAKALAATCSFPRAAPRPWCLKVSLSCGRCGEQVVIRGDVSQTAEGRCRAPVLLRAALPTAHRTSAAGKLCPCPCPIPGDPRPRHLPWDSQELTAEWPAPLSKQTQVARNACAPLPLSSLLHFEMWATAAAAPVLPLLAAAHSQPAATRSLAAAAATAATPCAASWPGEAVGLQSRRCSGHRASTSGRVACAASAPAAEGAAGPASSLQRKQYDVVALSNLCVDIVHNVPELPPADAESRRRLLQQLTAAPPPIEQWEVGGNTNFLIAASRLGLRTASVGHLVSCLLACKHHCVAAAARTPSPSTHHQPAHLVCPVPSAKRVAHSNPPTLPPPATAGPRHLRPLHAGSPAGRGSSQH